MVQPDTARLAPYEEARRVTSDELDVLEVEDERSMGSRLLIDQPLELRYVLGFDATADREADLLAVDRSLDPQHREVPPAMPRCDQSAIRFTEVLE